MTDTTDSLDVIEPAPGEFIIAGTSYKIRPLTIGQIPPFTRALRPMMGALVGVIQGKDAAAMGVGMLDLVADHGEQIIELVSIATGLPASTVSAADAAELLPAVQAVIAVNKDFLIGRLIPALRAAVAR